MARQNPAQQPAPNPNAQTNGPSDPNAKAAPTGGPVKTADGAMTFSTGSVFTITYSQLSPDNKTLYTASWDGPLNLWDLETLKERERIDLPNPGEVKQNQPRCALSPDGKLLVFAYFDNLNVLDLATKKATRIEVPIINLEPGKKSYNDHPTPPTVGGSGAGPRFMPNSTTFACRYGDQLALWDVKTRKFIKTLPTGKNSTLTPRLDQTIGLSEAIPGPVKLQVWTLSDAKTPPTPKEFDMPPSPAKLSYSSMACSPSGKILALCGWMDSRDKVYTHKPHGVQLIDFATKKAMGKFIEVPPLQPEGDWTNEWMSNLVFTPDEKFAVYCAGMGYGLHLIDITQQKLVGSIAFENIRSQNDGGTNAMWTSDGKKLVVTFKNQVKVWDASAVPWK